MVSTNITSLPVEIPNRICQDIDILDLFALRLSSFSLALKTQHHFAFRAFEKILLVLTSDGLQVLKHIASHEVFRKHVKNVTGDQGLWIVTTHFLGNHEWSAEDMDHLQQGYATHATDSEKRNFREETVSLPERSREERHALYQDAVADHLKVRDGQVIQAALEHCLPSFTNLHIAAHLNVGRPPDAPGRFKGIRGLRKQLRFDPLHVVGGESKHSHTTNAKILSILLAAIASTKTKIKYLDTSTGDLVCPVAHNGLHFTSAEKVLLLPIIQTLVGLGLYCSSSHKDLLAQEALEPNSDGKSKDTLEFLAKAAPNLKTLQVRFDNRHKAEDDREPLVDQHFVWMSQKFHFSRLSRLHLFNIRTTTSSLMQLLRSAMPTLRIFVFGSITLRHYGNFPSPMERDDEFFDNGVRVWREVLNLVRDQGSLRQLGVDKLMYQNQRIDIIAHYAERTAHVSIQDWIDELKLFAMDEILHEPRPADIQAPVST
ncbi:hypothetical protein BO94DRAFT_583371 [Aspergillus sclerotioniger CBS 115572]|uniref:F-box domain-containing protein n=1 Tax=Aspergillus sclerotioniger CBS 115572 TaxID=1450535 RepID=A0A317X4K9_9EURO|nr:hypothetical protein BO94DRAFT_583371 [Aspergillus sclerotioniger CBS 115572]PWY93131.1 hypothetical protein BO94DRAFT_583371 [Aspergillus sclerotioniger CBS 115572]